MGWKTKKFPKNIKHMKQFDPLSFFAFIGMCHEKLDRPVYLVHLSLS